MFFIGDCEGISKVSIFVVVKADMGIAVARLIKEGKRGGSNLLLGLVSITPL
jgi:hypothetical protein